MNGIFCCSILFIYNNKLQTWFYLFVCKLHFKSPDLISRKNPIKHTFEYFFQKCRFRSNQVYVRRLLIHNLQKRAVHDITWMNLIVLALDSCVLFQKHILFMTVHLLLIICVMKYRRAYLHPALLLCTYGIRTSWCAGWEKCGNLLLTNSEINLLHHAELNMCIFNKEPEA